jgi:uridine kinase
MCKPMHEKYIDPSKKYADIILKDFSLKKVLNLISKTIK